MGGKSSSSSSNTTKTTYETTDNRGYVETGGLGISGSENVTIESADAEVLGIALDFARDAGQTAIDQIAGTADESLSILREAKEDNAKEIATTVTKWLFGSASLIAIAWVFMRKKG